MSHSEGLFRLDGTTTISLSGGRTSAFMLWRVLREHGGTLPPNTYVLFANTGKEREETLLFVRECAERWAVPVVWLEYVPVLGGDRVGFRVTNYTDASRNGEPFIAMMDHERYVPNQRTRICTKNLKVLVMEAYLRSLGLEPGDYTEVIGFRADELSRVAKSKAGEDNEDRLLRFPLYDAGVRKEDVLAFWNTQPFNLQLEPHESNCDLCFLKGNAIRLSILRAKPERADWWIAQEELRGHRFTKKGRKTYADLKAKAVATPTLPELIEPIDVDDVTMPCGCHD